MNAVFNLDYVKKIAEAVRADGLDAILIAPSEDLLLIAGHNPLFCERFQGLFVKADGEYFYVCNLLTRDEMKKTLPNGKVYAWFDGDGFTGTVRTALEENGLIGKTIGVNMTVRAFNILEISREADVKWASARQLPHEIRIIKTEAEIDAMRRAARIAEEALHRTLDETSAQIADPRCGFPTEGEIRAKLLDHMLKLGGKTPRAIVASGPNGGYPHYVGISRTVRKGDAIVIDFSCEVNLVRTDITRTIFIGEPSEKQRDVYSIVRRANEAAEAMLGNGVWIPDIDEAARKVIRDAGYGEYFTTRLGHGIGCLGHESPDIKKNNPRRLEPGMTFTIEPGIYLPTEKGGQEGFGVRIEDCVAIHADGTKEILHTFTKDFTVIPA